MPWHTVAEGEWLHQIAHRYGFSDPDAIWQLAENEAVRKAKRDPNQLLPGDRIFLLSDNAHLLAMNRFNGELLWETEMADWRLNYNGTSAPLNNHSAKPNAMAAQTTAPAT